MMEQFFLQAIGIFFVGVLCGAGIVLLMNKLGSGSASPKKVRDEYQRYQEEVESHFEETSKKFKDMTEQYQDLYRHLSVGATSLCRPDSVAAALADESDPMRSPPKLASDTAQQEPLQQNDDADVAKAKVVKADVEKAKIAKTKESKEQGKKTDKDAPKEGVEDAPEKPLESKKPI